MQNATYLFTDADNTLWDTDAIFAHAQLEMLREIESHLGVADASREERGLAFIRALDQRIAAAHPDHLRYPPALLADGLARAILGEDPATVAEANYRWQTNSPYLGVVERFTEHLERVPQLRPGVEKTLRQASTLGIPVIIITESSKEKCLHTLQQHGLERHVEDVISSKKSQQLFFDLRRMVSAQRALMVGDQLDRDIAFAHAAGFETFYFASGFRPYWHDKSIVTPDHEIDRYDALIEFLDQSDERISSGVDTGAHN